MSYKNEHDACGIGAVVQIDGKVSHDVVDNALSIVEKLEHRAGKDSTGKVGDGVGILLQISHSFFKHVCKEINIELQKPRDYAVGMFFFPNHMLERNQAKRLFETIVSNENCEVLGWRKVKTDASILGKKALACMPYIEQVFIKKPDFVSSDLEFDKLLYVIRRQFEKSCPDTYVVSLSCRTIVYKGMFLVDQLRKFYLDLDDPNYKSTIAIVHSRFSTNTTPSWQRAHPNRLIAHNGEINTIQGNINRMLAREESMSSDFLNKNKNKILPVIDPKGSDSAILDNTLEFLMMNDIELAKAVMITIPEAWKNSLQDSLKRDFYHYYATMMEPWDGPAAILFSDGDVLGAVLDRNGLRPARYYVTDDNMLILSSEVGVLDVDEKKILKKSRLQPGKMLLVDTKNKEIIDDETIKDRYASNNPYGEWLDGSLLKLKDLKATDKKTVKLTTQERQSLYKYFGYTYEEVNDLILEMARIQKEPTFSMGTDVPLAILSNLHPSLFHYFKQRFAQVTNPPIDSIREEIITDTTIYVGPNGNILKENKNNCKVLEINNPILDARDMDKIKHLNNNTLVPQVISLLYYRGMPLKEAMEELFVKCDKAYHEGANILILSDRGIDESHMAIPSLLVISGLEQHLIKTKKRTSVSIILESGEPRTVHEFACLLGFGATAIYPYLAHECIGENIEKGNLDKEVSIAIKDYNLAVLHGIVKIAAKMGISTLQSYQSAQIFEAVGISQEVIDQYFTNTISTVGGIGLKQIEEDLTYHHKRAFDVLGLKTDMSLDSIGFHKLRYGRHTEDHLYDAKTITLLQQAAQTNDYQLFKEYTHRLHNKKIMHNLRDSFEIVTDASPIPLDEVESEEEIVKRFKTGAMSYGSISKEAHTCLAVAMNRLHGKSNTGEGGEDPKRFHTEENSAIKQVASGRFGVTSEYLINAQEIQIKMAQGAKPGEGGHLPAQKVYPWIAKTRHSTPGVSLISPPPHHDIYSIEDLAQLIYDLKNANEKARISVKLVSEAGVGTIACGVAKAGATVVLISGYDGGTGAAGQSSIHHAGLPWELGLAQAHKDLIDNDLRSRVILETDGKLMSGRDVAIAALLGAEEYGFATAPLVVMGCRMMRVCNLDTCPFGVATQNQELRKRFKGKPEYVINFMHFIARELREIMAELGMHTLDEMIGRQDLLKIKKELKPRQELLELEKILTSNMNIHHEEMKSYDFKLEETLDKRMIIPHFTQNNSQLEVAVNCTNRSIGTLFGSYITQSQGNDVKEDTYQIKCVGGAGQSFGAFVPSGITLHLIGDANDYFGKGLSGGKLIASLHKDSKLKSNENIIIGNVALYGATSGKAFIQGVAGERFGVRNSGATIVCEGCGDHGLEYMTGGIALLLGKTGRNFAAGMSGGIAYVYDKDHDLYKRLNKEMVIMNEVEKKTDIETIHALMKEHFQNTGSQIAKQLLDNFEESLKDFKVIIPHDYLKIKEKIKSLCDKGFSQNEAELQAFQEIFEQKEV